MLLTPTEAAAHHSNEHGQKTEKAIMEYYNILKSRVELEILHNHLPCRTISIGNCGFSSDMVLTRNECKTVFNTFANELRALGWHVLVTESSHHFFIKWQADPYKWYQKISWTEKI